MARQDKTWNVGHVCMCERGVYSSTGFTTSSCTKHVDRRLLGRHYQAPAESDLARGTLHSTKVGRGASPGHAVHGVNRNNNYPQSAHSLQNTTIRQALAMWLFALQHWWRRCNEKASAYLRHRGEGIASAKTVLAVLRCHNSATVQQCNSHVHSRTFVRSCRRPPHYYPPTELFSSPCHSIRKRCLLRQHYGST